MATKTKLATMARPPMIGEGPLSPGLWHWAWAIDRDGPRPRPWGTKTAMTEDGAAPRAWEQATYRGSGATEAEAIAALAEDCATWHRIHRGEQA
jgi:hypothetical protein